MARTKQIKKPCDLCGREFVASAMHQHRRKCARDNSAADLPGKPAEKPAETSAEKSPAQKPGEAQKTEIILFTEPKPEAVKAQDHEGGISRFFGSLADFVKDHPDELMPIVATAAAMIFPGGLPGQAQTQPQLAAADDNRTWAEKGHW
jgi:hypothetical protein